MTFVVWNPILHQLIRFSDQMLILKDGKTARCYEQSEFNEKNISLILLGNVTGVNRTEIFPEMGEPVFQMKNVSDSYLYNISLSIRSGEIRFVQCENAKAYRICTAFYLVNHRRTADT